MMLFVRSIIVPSVRYIETWRDNTRASLKLSRMSSNATRSSLENEFAMIGS